MKLQALAQALGCVLDGDGDVDIDGVAAIDDARSGTITFLADPKLARHLQTTRASAIVVGVDAPAVALPALRTPDPYAAFVSAVALFHPTAPPAPGIHPSAVVAASARVGARATIGPHCVVGEGVVIGADAALLARVTVYADVRIGDGFTAHAGVTIREGVRIGDRVTVHAGAVIGSDGFGYLPGPDGARKIPQVGTVVIEDDVEIGANTTIDRAALGATVIGRGAKLDNLVMVAHNCRIGPYSMLSAQVGLAGSTTVGAGVLMGGQVGLAGHLTVGDGAQIAAQAGVHSDVPAGGAVGGTPAVPVRKWHRMAGVVYRLPELFRRVRRLERRLGLDEPADDA